MHIPQRDKRTREDILEYIKKCAGQYVPEWRYDPEDEDAGAALVSLFADMTCENIRRLNLSAAGDSFSFFDEIHAKMLPASPAEGFITFEFPDGLESEAEVPRRTRLLAETDQGPLVFETQEDVLVRQMVVEKIYLSDSKEDAIYQLFDKAQDKIPSFFLFRGEGENLQRHRICFCFEKGLDIQTTAEARLSFEITQKGVEEFEWDKVVQDQRKITFSYGTAEGYAHVSMKQTEEHDGEESSQPDAEKGIEDGQEGIFRFCITGGEEGIAVKEEFQSMYVIQAEIFDARLFSQIYFSSLALSIKSQDRKPDSIHVNGTDQEFEDFLVFGETPSVYDEFYITSEEVFGKAGALIEVRFDLDFVKIPLEAALDEKVAWKTIMKKKDFIPDKEYDITISEVIWEYFNGYGWTRLAGANVYRNLFAVEEGLHGRRVNMEFICPADIQRVLVNSAENYAIRARISKMNNAYKTKGAYIAPVAGRVSLSYDYSMAPLKPSRIFRWNHLEMQEISKEELYQKGFSVSFSDDLREYQSSPNKRKSENTACYLGFTHPPVGGPLKLLFTMHDTMPQHMPPIEWEYLGSSGWEKMHLVDGTKGFHHTGLVSWFGSSDIRKTLLFGQELFWIRLLDTVNADQGRDRNALCPKIEGIYPNSISILGIETVEEVYGIAPYAEEKKIMLPFSDIVDARVWVLERRDYEKGAMQQIWESWKEVEELCEKSSVRREFVLDRQEGILMFPKYMHSTCLSDQGEIAVRIRYEHCQGDRGNLKAGAIKRLDRTIGFISGCYNPVAAIGGIPREKPLEALERNAQILRHGYRCVSTGDYEDMAWEATRNISKARCFSGYNQKGKKEPGAVTLVILPKEYDENPYSFEKIKVQIYEYLSAHMDGNIVNLGKFYIVKPEMIRLDVKAVIELMREKEVFRVRHRALEEMDQFFHPLYGNFYGEGWEIGTLPNQNQIMHALKRVEGVKHVHQLALRKFCKGRFEEFEIYEEQQLPFYLLPKSGNHEVLIQMAENQP